MEFAIQVNASPYQSQGGETAYQFIKAALSKGHQIGRVFFYHEGIYQGMRFATPPTDERHPVRRWSELGQDYAVDMVICVSAAQRRGLLVNQEAVRIGKLDQDLAAGFRIAGLGLWIEACMKADRVLVFGR